jgi:hypothetical protein
MTSPLQSRPRWWEAVLAVLVVAGVAYLLFSGLFDSIR